ncbi:MAG: NupC/NupG family nucleoside CNT transporter [Planctomycetes bacterium]|nr:NupC/NupG family nucleoside CNT transporter [Planctomycetota bacterium]
MPVLRGLLGLLFFCVVAWLMSSHKRKVPVRVVVWGLLLQFGLAWALLQTETGRAVFEELASWVSKLVSMASPGAAMVFGPLADPSTSGGFIFAFAGSGLVVIIFFSALMSLLYHLGVMQVVIYVLAKIMSALMGVSGAEAMAMAANVFVGQTEAPLVVKPYIAGMTNSELNAMMTGGFATIAGSVLAVYMGVLGPEYAPHLLTASVLSAPAAFVIAKIALPETEVSVTGSKVELRIERTAHNLIEAAANGTTDGLNLWLNVMAMLIAFVALIHLIDWPIGWIGEHWFGMPDLGLQRIFGWVFAPVSWIMGVNGWHDCQVFGSLLGTKIAVNEFVAYTHLHEAVPGAMANISPDRVFESARSAKMAAYALCGFANFSSIGIQIGGISPLAPTRKTDLSRLAFRAMLGGAFASWMTATIAGMFL